ncbi:hypothetical protein RJ639_018082 [Escallonia herrerae]|uniref:Amino acid transporter transmembrane domain-containing protein n=1 Tax=Escallonia herrerae TaxID=1293975 RepID=A0AA88V7G1_9ASTE|nr:hypothetical protein RJ639_018082 [Escallonia herrerae]
MADRPSRKAELCNLIDFATAARPRIAGFREDRGPNMKPTNKDEVGVAPLLSKYQSIEDEGPEGSSISSAVFNVSTSMIGAGIMSIPSTLKEISLKGHCTRAFYKKVWHALVELAYICTPFLCAICFASSALAAACSLMSLHQVHDRSAAKDKMLPELELKSKAKSLGHTSAISVLLALVFVAVSSAMAVYAMWQGETQQLRLLPDFDNGVSYFELFTTTPVLATGLACHVTSKNDRLGDAI